MTLSLTSAQRDALYEVILIRLSGIDVVWRLGGSRMSNRKEGRQCVPPPNPGATHATTISLPAKVRRFEGAGPAIDPDDLREVLADKGATGSGPVELEIEDAADARRVFRQLAVLAELLIPTPASACRQIVAAVNAAPGLYRV